MLIERRFVWRDGRPDENDEIRSSTVDRFVTRGGVLFRLRGWDMRYTPGQPRITDAVYDEASSSGG